MRQNVAAGGQDHRDHRQREPHKAERDGELQIAVMAVADRVHPTGADVIVQRRQRAGIGKRAETGAEPGVIADEGDFRLPDRRAARDSCGSEGCARWHRS